MIITKFRPENFDLVKSFISKCKAQEFSFRCLEQETAIIAFDDNGDIVGLGMQWRNGLHNKTIVIEVCVLPSKRREGLGTKLFNKLVEEYPPNENDFAFDIKCESEDTEIQKFAESLGFDHYLSCYNNIFKIEDMKVVENNLELIKLSDFYKVESNKDKVKKFHCSLYDRDHDPFLPLNKDKDVRYDYYSDGDPEHGVVILKGDEIVGCSFAYLNFEDELEEQIEDVTCLHGYAEGRDVNEEAFLVQALYGYQINLLKEKGRKNVYIEFDSIELISDLMLKWLPYTKKPLLRFQKRL